MFGTKKAELALEKAELALKQIDELAQAIDPYHKIHGWLEFSEKFNSIGNMTASYGTIFERLQKIEDSNFGALSKFIEALLVHFKLELVNEPAKTIVRKKGEK